MKKSFKIEVDCANCANLVENALKKESGIKDVVVNFMTQKMKVEFEDSVDVEAMKENMLKTARKIEPDFEIE
jgi:copper chaperone CopZ